VNIEQAIHQLWAGNQTLESMLTSDSVKTGRSFSDSIPYATIERKSNQTVFRTNDGSAMDETRLKIEIWHDSYDSARTIAEQVKTTFDRSEFQLTENDRVIQIRRFNDSATQDENGVWCFGIEFIAYVYLSLGV